MIIIEGNEGKSCKIDEMSKVWSKRDTIIINTTKLKVNAWVGFDVICFEDGLEYLFEVIKKDRIFFDKYKRIVLYANCDRGMIFKTSEFEKELMKKHPFREIVLTVQINEKSLLVYEV